MSALGGRGLVGLRCNESRRRGSTRPACCSVVLDGSTASVQPSAPLLERSSVNRALASGGTAASGTLRTFQKLEGARNVSDGMVPMDCGGLGSFLGRTTKSTRLFGTRAV